MRTEEQEFLELEKKLDAKTIDCKERATQEMREWFFDKEGWFASDNVIIKKWRER